MTLAAVLERRRADPESWRYTDLSTLKATTFELATQEADLSLPQKLADQRLVFVNGSYRPDLSDLKNLPPGFVTLEEENTCCLSLPDRHCLVTAPVELLFITGGGKQPQESTTRLKVSLGKSARLTLIERHVAEPGAVRASIFESEIQLEAQAKLIHGRIVDGKASSIHLATTNVRVDGGAYYDAFSLTRDGKLTRQDILVSLLGPLAEARLLGVKVLGDDSHADTSICVRHEAPHGTSRQIYKSVLADKARGVFQGKIHVAPGAQKTDGHQLCRALLLSHQAEMDAKPELEIYADDVKCSHGCAIGDLDEQALFYLLSRGIPQDEARALLVEAFVQEVVDQIQAEELAVFVRQEVQAWLRR